VNQMYLVPVRESRAGTLALRTGRLVSGELVGLAFTSEASLLLTLGPSQQWIWLAPSALRGMLAPLGVSQVRVDPRPIAELDAERSSAERLPAPAGANGSAPHSAPRAHASAIGAASSAQR
jgi:hypothetical protein